MWVTQCHKPPMTGNGLYHLRMIYCCVSHIIYYIYIYMYNYWVIMGYIWLVYIPIHSEHLIGCLISIRLDVCKTIEFQHVPPSTPKISRSTYLGFSEKKHIPCFNGSCFPISTTWAIQWHAAFYETQQVQQRHSQLTSQVIRRSWSCLQSA